jgi:cell wall-associated NlpC family hydrolase
MKVVKFVILFVLIIGCWSVKAQSITPDSAVRQTQNYTPTDSVIPADSLVRQILTYSAQFLGRPYRYAASGPKSFDCSGFTSFVFREFGYKLPHSCRQQINQGQRVDKNEMKPGDLIFFTSSRSKGAAGHVGIVVENYGDGNIRFIHSSSYHKIGVRYDTLTDGHYARRYITGLRVLENTDSNNITSL